MSAKLQRRSSSSEDASYAPQDTGNLQTPLPWVDGTCSGLSEDSRYILQSFLDEAHPQIEQWRRWRNGEGWSDDSVSSRIPDISILELVANTLEQPMFTCEGEEDWFGVSADDAMIRDSLTQGVDGAAGLSGGDIDLVNEWLSYLGRTDSTALGDYFCLAPQPVQHRYSVHTGIEVGAGVGLGLGGQVKAGGFELSLGCYPKAEVKAGSIEFGYENDLGMKWSRTYLRGGGGIGGECAARFSLPIIGNIFGGGGSDDLCSGSASSDTWYGPGDFNGGMVEGDASVDGGVGLNAKVGVGGMYVIPMDKPNLLFDTTGVCISGGASGGAGVGGTVGGGGQFDIGTPDFENSAVRSTGSDGALGACTEGPTHDPTPGPMVQAMRRELYFDTGSADPQQGERGGENIAALQALVTSLAAVSGEFPPDKVTIEVIGHASPRWKSADARGGELNNLELAQERADEVLGLVVSAYALYGPDWPVPTTHVAGICPVEEDKPAAHEAASSMGSREGLAETGDRSNDWQRYRRASVLIRLERTDWMRRTISGG